jgi:heme-degrading monooxygenase HmoA
MASEQKGGTAMVICLFGEHYQPDADKDELNRLATQLLGVLQAMPGFISYNFYTAENGEGLGLVRFTSRAALEAWRDDPTHRATWERATEFYQQFWIQDCETYREYIWEDGRRHDADLTTVFHERSTPPHAAKV